MARTRAMAFARGTITPEQGGGCCTAASVAIDPVRGSVRTESSVLISARSKLRR
jgi:hypothetical protein